MSASLAVSVLATNVAPMTWAERYPEQKLVPYDSDWPSRYCRIEADLRPLLGPGWEFEHAGSTSIPGLAAKPVIDVAMSMPQGVGSSEIRERFRAAGWSDPTPVGDHLFTAVPAQGVRIAIGHIFTAAQWPEAHVRLFAAWLRAHDLDRDRCSSLKEDLVAQGVWSSAYTESKGSFVLEIVNQARAELGLVATRGPL